jgi:predicted permease
MTIVREWLCRLWGSITGPRRDRDLEEELKTHLAFAEEDALRHASSSDPVRAARVKSGGVVQAMDALRDQRGLPCLDDLRRDLIYVLRSLHRNPGFAAVAILTLAIGIGANTAVFSVVNSVLLKPLPYPNADELVNVAHTAPGFGGLSSLSSGLLDLSPSMFVTYSENNRTFQALGVWTTRTMSVTGLAEPEEVRGVLISDGVLEALDVQATLGRWLISPDHVPGNAATVLLSYGYWQRRFGGNHAVIGRKIIVDSRPREIVGVMPRAFRIVDADSDLILPLVFERARLILPGFTYRSIARLKPGVTIAQADADIARMVPIWLSSWPAAPGIDPRLYERARIAPALRPLKKEVIGDVGDVLWVLMATIGIVMVIASANVANLMLVRAESGRQEVAVRTALGAGRGHIVLQRLLEGLSLAVIGGALGVVLANAGLRVLLAVGPGRLPRLNEIHLDAWAFAFAATVSLFAGLLCGLIPAFKYDSRRIVIALRSGGRSATDAHDRHLTRNILVTAQVALASLLLVSAGLMIRTFEALGNVKPGFSNAEELQLMRISIPNTLVQEAERVIRIQNQILDQLAAIPGASSVAFSSAMPMEGFAHNWDAITVEGKTCSDSEIPPMRVFKSISPGLLHTAGTRLIAGRDYDWTDLYGRRSVVMVSESLASELWGNASAALGKRLHTCLPTAPLREVIGVVEEVYDNGVHQPAPAIVYWPAFGEDPYFTGQVEPTRSVTFVIRTDRAGTQGLLAELSQAVWSVNGSLPLASVRTMREVYDQSMARTSFALVMLGIAASLALLLGTIGLYGVISYVVSQRTREIGIRLALGAQQRELCRMVVQSGLELAALGVAIGLTAAVGVTRLMSSLLFGISSVDPGTYVAVAVVLVTFAVLASYVPAHRAAHVDPLVALRVD